MEYFYETEEVIIGCYGVDKQLYLAKYNNSLEKMDELYQS